MGTRYGRWTILDPTDHRSRVLCQCDCGTQRILQRHNLVTGRTNSCGCLRNEQLSQKLHNKTWPQHETHRDTHVQPGAKFGRWTVLQPAQPGKKNRTALCQCQCGTQRHVAATHLLTGKTKSCGCLRRDASRNRMTT